MRQIIDGLGVVLACIEGILLALTGLGMALTNKIRRV